MSRAHFAWAAVAAALAAIAMPVTPAEAGEPSPALAIVALRVAEGEETWHAVNDFRLDWQRADGDRTVSAVHYLIRDAGEELVTPPTEIPGEVEPIEHLHVPSGPGAYTVEVWLEGAQGETGRSATATLRFDDARPGVALPVAPTGWVAGGGAAVVRIAHPAGPLPVSGIRGYAISVDRGQESTPCLAVDTCTLTETDLDGGIGDDTAWLGILPEGTSFARVVAVSGSGVRSATVGSAAIHVDATRPQVVLSGTPRGWSNRPVSLTATASDVLSGMTASGAYTAIAVDGGTPFTAPGNAVSAPVTGEGVHRVDYYARDAAGNVADGEAGAPPPARAVVRIDETAPRVAFAAAQDPSEPERIEAVVADALSGIDPNRGTIAVREAGSREPFEPLPTRPSAEGLVARWDSDAYPAGSYEFRATGYDAAGNPGTGERRLGGARMVLPNPLKQPTELAAGFGGRRLVWHRCVRKDGARRCRRETIEDFEMRPRSRLVPYGRGTAFGGRLRTAQGTAAAGLPIAVTETFASGADPPSRTTVAQTRPDGTFLVHLAPGPSRRVEASFPGNRLLSASGAPAVRFAVLASVRLRASAATARVGGAPVLFSGRVGAQGTAIPADGMPIELQFRLPGSQWNEFRTVQTDRTGRFRYAYAFSDDDSRGVRFQFRAFLPGQAGWPYESATSHPVSVTGR